MVPGVDRRRQSAWVDDRLLFHHNHANYMADFVANDDIDDGVQCQQNRCDAKTIHTHRDRAEWFSHSRMGRVRPWTHTLILLLFTFGFVYEVCSGDENICCQKCQTLTQTQTHSQCWQNTKKVRRSHTTHGHALQSNQTALYYLFVVWLCGTHFRLWRFGACVLLCMLLIHSIHSIVSDQQNVCFT